jgi:hypothetical protein
VADRGNRRIQVFDTDGKFLRQFTIDVPVPAEACTAFGDPPPSGPPAAGANQSMSAGAPDAMCITPGPNQVLYVADLFPGRIYKVSLEGKVLGVLGKSGKQLGQVGWVHALACASQNVVYAAELLNWRVQKLVLHPEKAHTPSSAASVDIPGLRQVMADLAAGAPDLRRGFMEAVLAYRRTSFVPKDPCDAPDSLNK